jgi:hypothetical protein
MRVMMKSYMTTVSGLELKPGDFAAFDDDECERLVRVGGARYPAPGEEAASGPTVEEYVAAGYQAANYPPTGYESRSTPEEIAAAILGQKVKASSLQGKTVAELKAIAVERKVELAADVVKKDDIIAALELAAEAAAKAAAVPT